MKKVIETLIYILSYLGIDPQLFFIGALGTIPVVYKDRKKGWIHNSINVLSGALCANYISPFVIELFAVKVSQFGISFIVGYAGLKFVDSLLESIKDKFKENGR
jgi:hypothetical protein